VGFKSDGAVNLKETGIFCCFVDEVEAIAALVAHANEVSFPVGVMRFARATYYAGDEIFVLRVKPKKFVE
jgi:hypothetical protein